MSLGKSERMPPHFNLRFSTGVKIAVLTFLMTSVAIALVVAVSVNSEYITNSWLVDALFVSVVAAAAIVILVLIANRINSSLSNYAGFAENLGDCDQPPLAEETFLKELGNLGSALNVAHRRLLDKETIQEIDSADQSQYAKLVEDSPNIVLLMNSDHEILYLNAQGRKIADTVAMGGENISSILPLTPKELVNKCIGNNETLLDQVGSCLNKKYLWTVMPLAGERLLQAHGTLMLQRRKTDTMQPMQNITNRQTRLYSISEHPDYRRYRGSILVIDSEETVQGMISRYFKKNGFRTFSARNGDEGLELAERYKPNLITLDIMMPGKNGWMVLSSLKENQELSGIPVVIISSVGNRRFVHAMGANDYVPKPIDWDVLGKVANKLTLEYRQSIA